MHMELVVIAQHVLYHYIEFVQVSVCVDDLESNSNPYHETDERKE